MPNHSEQDDELDLRKGNIRSCTRSDCHGGKGLSAESNPAKQPLPTSGREAEGRSERPLKIAIACQGGGSHTAFTAGALKRILREKRHRLEIVGLSGSSGGAINALLAWYGLLKNDKELSLNLLDWFWKDMAAKDPQDMMLNAAVVWNARMKDMAPVPDLNPYYFPPWAQAHIRELLEKYVDFAEARRLLKPTSPRMLVSAIEVITGRLKIFGASELTADALLASAADPTLFRAVRVDSHVYWDGLLACNPPVAEFMNGTDNSIKPDEIWVVHINPDRRPKEPTSVGTIRDRRNGLIGNLALHEEVSYLKTCNSWIKKGYLPSNQFKLVDIRTIELQYELDHESKLDRSWPFIKGLMEHGEEQADKFLSGLESEPAPWVG